MYYQLTQVERYQIEIYLQEKYSISKISRNTGRPRSTIRDEINRNSVDGHYDAEKAHLKALERKRNKRSMPRSIGEYLWQIVRSYLAKLWSPEQISGVLKNEGVKISHEWIYRYIWKDKVNGGILYTYLRRSGRKYNKRSSTDSGRGLIRNRVDIDKRPTIVEDKTRVGDWEGDLVMGKGSSGAVVTLVERKTRFSKFRKIQRKTAAETNVGILKAFKTIRTALLLTITFDNGKEFAWHEHITNMLGISVYFAKPYHSWERGLNENTNGLLRQYLPKDTSFEGLTDDKLQWIEDELNDRPRKCLGFKTPRQMMELFLAA